MRTWRAMCETIHLTALGLWLGAVVMSGAAAAVLFPAMKSLAPTLPAYSNYTGEHWRLAAGYPAARLFGICDAVQLVCGVLAAVSLATLVGVARVRVRRPAMLIRGGAFVLAMGALAFQLFFLAPGMWKSLASFRVAAMAGENEVAEKFRAAFDAAHPVASNTLGAIAMSVLVALVSGAWSASTHERSAGEGERAPEGGAAGKTVIETPRLARTGR